MSKTRSSIFLSMLSGSLALTGQTWNTPKCTTTIVENDKTEYEVDYTNWNWLDPTGVVRYFPGTSVYDISYFNGDGGKKITTYSNLNNVQASDGSYWFLSTGMAKNGSISATGSMFPKFQILAVYYAAPGPSSSISYGGTHMASTKVTLDNTFTHSTDISLKLGAFSNGMTLGASWSQSSEDATSVLSQSSAANSWGVKNGLAVPGSLVTASYNSNPAFINHDNDIILVWLNPAINIVASSPTTISYVPVLNPFSSPNSTLGTMGDYFSEITVNGIKTYQADIVALQVGWLNGHVAWPTDGTLRRCCRNWDNSYAQDSQLDNTDWTNPLGQVTAQELSRHRSLFYTLPDGTQPDVAALLSVDPWVADPTGASIIANDPYRYVNVTTDGMPANTPNDPNSAPVSFQLPNTTGEQPVSGLTLTDMRKNESVNTKTSSQSIKVSATIGTFAQSLTVTDTTTYTYKSINDATSQTLSTSSYQIYCPVDGLDSVGNAIVQPYNTTIDVYQDTRFGTFMFTYPNFTAVDPHLALALAQDWISPVALYYTTPKATYTVGTPIAQNKPNVSGGTVASYSIVPALPPGLYLNPSTGVISGTPTAATPTCNYSVTALNPGGNAITAVTITIE